MEDLDIHIDTGEDPELDAAPPVLDSGDRASLWPKLAALAAVLLLAAAVYGMYRGTGEEPSADPVPPEAATPTSAPSSEAPTTTVPDEITSAIAAVDAWETFSSTGDLADMNATFDPAGPQYALFVDQANRIDSGSAWRFELTDVTYAHEDDVLTVSTDLVVTGPGDQRATYPYDFIFLAGSEKVWTVVDRRSPAEAVMPPSPDVVQAATDTWRMITATGGATRPPGADEWLTSNSITLLAQVIAGTSEPAGPLTDPDDVLVELTGWADQNGLDNPTDIVVRILSDTGLDTVEADQLTGWAQPGHDRVLAIVAQDDRPVVIPFELEDGRWKLDLVSALALEGTTR